MGMVQGKVTPKQVLYIRKSLQLLGFNPSIFGTKLIIKAVQYLMINQTEYFELFDVYEYLASSTPFTINQVSSYISYAISKRNILKSKQNFEKVFGYEYDDYVFTAKNLIEELANVVEIYE